MTEPAVANQTHTDEDGPNTPAAAVIGDANADHPMAHMMQPIIDALKTCYDPEIPVDIWELGLIYRIDVGTDGAAEIDMTLTSPMCPVAGELPLQVQNAVASVDGITTCKVDLVWDPPWRPDMMSDVAKIQLDMF
ncbi:MAG TPA: iron-sulfur cluster assembly protein [Azospirillum sp.]|nr:iron-sulfur cluster assembly protein [Azospirillum sp.]